MSKSKIKLFILTLVLAVFTPVNSTSENPKVSHYSGSCWYNRSMISYYEEDDVIGVSYGTVTWHQNGEPYDVISADCEGFVRESGYYCGDGEQSRLINTHWQTGGAVLCACGFGFSADSNGSVVASVPRGNGWCEGTRTVHVEVWSCPDDDNDDYETCDGDCDDNTSGDPANCPTDPEDCNENYSFPDWSKCAICINPGAPEVCDGIDNNCDGTLLECEEYFTSGSKADCPKCCDDDSDECCESETSAPVNLSDGRVTIGPVTDFVIPGRGQEIKWERVDDSLKNITTILGDDAWYAKYNIFIKDSGTHNRVAVYFGNKALYFERYVAGSNTEYRKIGMQTYSLKKDGSGNYQLRDEDGKLYQFNSSKQLTSITDPHGNALTFTYTTPGSCSSSKLSKIENESEREIQLFYDDSYCRVEEIKLISADPDITLVEYGYNNDGYINSVKYNGSGTAYWTYTYEGSGSRNLTEVLDADGDIVEYHEYNGNGWGISSRTADEEISIVRTGATVYVTDERTLYVDSVTIDEDSRVSGGCIPCGTGSMVGAIHDALNNCA